MTLLRALAAPAFGVLLIGTMPLAAQDDCKPVFDALDKVMTVPVHIYSTTKVGDENKTSESIYTEDGIFTNATGKWTKSSMARLQVSQKEVEARKKATNVCRFVKDDTIDGDPVTIYSTRTVNGDQKIEGQIAISKKKGLPLRNEIDLMTGVKDAIHSHYSVRYEYDRVVPPKVE